MNTRFKTLHRHHAPLGYLSGCPTQNSALSLVSEWAEKQDNQMEQLFILEAAERDHTQPNLKHLYVCLYLCECEL